MTFDERRSWLDRAEELGVALGDSRWALGQRLTDQARDALQHEMLWGSSSWPVQRVGRLWALAHPLAAGFPLFGRKMDAEFKWCVTLAMWRRLAGLEAAPSDDLTKNAADS